MIAALISAFLALVAVGLGLFSMTKDEAFREKHANTIMQARVTMQGLAIIFLVLAFVSSS